MQKYLYLFVMMLCGAVGTDAQPTDTPGFAEPQIFRQEPQEAIFAFINNFNRGNLAGLEAAAGNVQGAIPDSSALEELLLVLISQGNSIQTRIVDTRIATKGDLATATLKVVLRDSLLRSVVQSETIQLKRHEEKVAMDGMVHTFIDWRIVPGVPEAIINSPQNSLVRTMATYVAFPQRMLKLSLLKLARLHMDQVAKGMKGFLSDWEGEFVKEYNGQPFLETQESWRCSVAMYMNEAALQVPRSTTGETYQFNLQLAGKRIPEIKQPAKTVMVYDGQDGQLTFRHDGLSIVLFVDGHIELVNHQQAAALIWKP